MIKISNLVIQTFTGPLLGIYLLGMFTRRAHQFGVLIGGALATVVAILAGFYWKVGFIWPAIYGLVVTLISGYVVSLLTPMWRRAEGSELTWRRVMARPIANEAPAPQATTTNLAGSNDMTSATGVSSLLSEAQ